MKNNWDLEQIRIHIHWTDKLLALGACGGNLRVEMINPLKGHTRQKLLTARVKVERFNSGYNNIEWYNNLTQKEFEEHLKDTIDVMIKSYHRGMLLLDEDYNWIENWQL